MIKNYKKNINSHYNNLLEQKGFNLKGLGWGKGKLNLRYKFFCKHLNFNNKKVLDFGCGLGYFYKFLMREKIKVKKFYGIEINQALIAYLKKKFKGDIQVFDKINNDIKVDISISNGVHNFRLKNHLKIFYKDINSLLNISKECVAISFINDNVDYRERHLSYKSLFDVIKFIRKKKLDYIIDQRFNKYETFIFIFKKTVK